MANIFQEFLYNDTETKKVIIAVGVDRLTEDKWRVFVGPAQCGIFETMTLAYQKLDEVIGNVLNDGWQFSDLRDEPIWR